MCNRSVLLEIVCVAAPLNRLIEGTHCVIAEFVVCVFAFPW